MKKREKTSAGIWMKRSVTDSLREKRLLQHWKKEAGGSEENICKSYP